MIEEIELAGLNLRYNSCRLKSPGAERVLLSSIATVVFACHEKCVSFDTSDLTLRVETMGRYSSAGLSTRQ